MSYCRFLDSDAYIFQDVSGGYTCCWCAFAKGGIANKHIISIFGLLLHCFRHSARGHDIPSDAYKEILGEIVKLQWFVFKLKEKNL